MQMCTSVAVFASGTLAGRWSGGWMDGDLYHSGFLCAVG